MRKTAYFLIAFTVLSTGSCGHSPKPVDSEQFAELTRDFVYGALALSPALATGAGLHEYKGVQLDEQLDDLSQAGIDQQKQFYLAMRKRLEAIGKTALRPQDAADFEIMQDQIALNLLEFDDIQSYKHNPTIYVELIGNALFTPYVLEYAPKPKRLRQIIARMGSVPRLIESARKNLASAPEVWNRVAREENDGNIALIDKTFREGLPADLRQPYDNAAGKALEALRGFNDWLANDLAQRKSDWRLGKERYALKFRYSLGIAQSPGQLLKDAESALESTRKRMLEIATPLHTRLLPDSRHDASLAVVVTETLREISKKHATPRTYFADARSDLDEARAFVQAKAVMALPQRGNLKVIETPEFMRGIYTVGGFNAAPPLEPQLGAFYWITPIPESWPPARIESKLSEYNHYGLKLLTIHEAMPGHYVQFEYANDVQPAARRLLRTVFGSGPYVEGWAVYVTEVMLQQGYLNNSPELMLTFLKQQLRVIANTILDVRLQTMNMSDDDAMQLMVDQAFQEKEEATAKLQRAKLSSTQLPTYYAGYRDWWRIRKAEEERRKGEFQPRAFHEAALGCGAVPLRVLAKLLE